MRFPTALVLIALLAVLTLPACADGPIVPAGDRLFGVSLGAGAQDPAIFPLYEQSGASAVTVAVNWGDCQPSDPGAADPKSDFTKLGDQPSMKSAKTKICQVALANPWADKIIGSDPARYWKLADAFVAEAAKYANTKGIKYFAIAGGAGSSQPYADTLKHTYAAIKAVSKDNIVIAGNLADGNDSTVQAFYDSGAKGYFDVLSLRAYPSDPKLGVDIFQIVTAHRVMARNGDGDKQVFVGQGWGPESGSAAQIDVLRTAVENGYRNILTDRDIYDPRWVLGAEFTALDTDNGKPKGDLLSDFTPSILNTSVDGAIAADGPVFNYVSDKPYRYTVTFTNNTGGGLALESFAVGWHADKDIRIEAKPDGEMPRTVAAGASAAASFTVTFPKEAIGQQVTLMGEVTYSISGRVHLADCWTTVLVTSPIEITLLPGKLIMDPSEGPKRVGMSIINHLDSAFEGKITLTPTPGLQIDRTVTDSRIDSFGLEAYVFTVTAGSDLAPGHYTVNVDVGDKAKDWVAVEIPAVAKKMKPQVDGKLDDWKDAARFSLAKAATGVDGKVSYDIAGKGRFAYDDTALYAAFEVDDAKHVQTRQPADMWQEDSIQIGIDPLLNGALTSSGGYKDDDYEYTFAQTASGPVVYRSKGTEWKPVGVVKDAKLAFRTEGGKSYYEIAIPWTEIVVPTDDKGKPGQRPFDPAKDKRLALSVLVNRNDGSDRTYVEWGGGLADNKEPRLFVPVVLQ